MILLTLVLVAVPGLVGAQSANQAGVLRVQGSAEIRAASDLAVARLGVAEEAATAEEAQSAVNVTANAITNAVRAVGIREDEVQTVRLMLSPVYATRRPGDTEQPRIVGYRAENTVSIRVEDLDLVGPVLDAALAAGANQVEGVSFGLQDDRVVRQQALRQAVATARGKANAMADALGVTLASIVSVSEDNVFLRQPIMETARTMAFQQVAAPAAVSPGEVVVSASVSIEYKIE